MNSIISPESVKALLEVLKSVGRALYFGFLALVVTVLSNLLVSGQLNDVNITIFGMTINLALALVAGISALIKLIDRYIKQNTAIDANGIAPAFLQR